MRIPQPSLAGGGAHCRPSRNSISMASNCYAAAPGAITMTLRFAPVRGPAPVRLWMALKSPAPGVFSPGRKHGFGVDSGCRAWKAYSEGCQIAGSLHVGGRNDDGTGLTEMVKLHTEGPSSLRRRDLFSTALATAIPLFGLPVAASGATVDLKEDVPTVNSEESEFGFDGLGKQRSEYTTGKIVALAQAGEGAVLFLGIEGFELPLRMVVGAAEAMAVLTAAQERKTQRPVTHEAWSSSLAAVGWKVERVMITALQRDVFYSRLVISLDSAASSGFGMSLKVDDFPEKWRLRSIDMRPSDGIALALRCRAPLFVHKPLVEEVLGPSSKGGESGKSPTDPLTRPGLQASWDNSLYMRSAALLGARGGNISEMVSLEDTRPSSQP